MKERPILFNGAMVQAILNGSKTQTRRVVKCYYDIRAVATHEQWSRGLAANNCFGRQITEEEITQKADQLKGRLHPLITNSGEMIGLLCPYGKVGDSLWVRETHMVNDVRGNALPESERENVEILYKATDMDYLNNCEDTEGLRWAPSIHMPRWASRIQLEITNVGVEHLQSITYSDAVAEGVIYEKGYTDPRHAYKWLWESINGEGSWAANPWVWVIEFEVLK